MSIYKYLDVPKSDISRPTNADDHCSSLEQVGPFFSLQEIQTLVTNILRTDRSFNQETKAQIHRMSNITQTLMFLRHFPGYTDSKNIPSSCSPECRYSAKEVTRQKNETIKKLTEGYFEARKCFEEELAQKDELMKQMRKKICQMEAQNQMLRKKVLNLGKEIQINQMGGKKNEYQELKHLLQAMNCKISQLESPEDKKISTPRSVVSSFEPAPCHRRKSSGYNQTASNHKMRRSLMLTKQQPTREEELNREIRELRLSQSKLIDKIQQRDRTIDELLELTSKNMRRNA